VHGLIKEAESKYLEVALSTPGEYADEATALLDLFFLPITPPQSFSYIVTTERVEPAPGRQPHTLASFPPLETRTDHLEPLHASRVSGVNA
jgi:hypothetical protein